MRLPTARWRQKDKLADELSVSQSEVADLKRTVSQLMTASSDVDAVRGSTEVPLGLCFQHVVYAAWHVCRLGIVFVIQRVRTWLLLYPRDMQKKNQLRLVGLDALGTLGIGVREAKLKPDQRGQYDGYNYAE